MPAGRGRTQDSSSFSVPEATTLARQQLRLLLGSASHREATTFQPWGPRPASPCACSPGGAGGGGCCWWC